MNRKAIVWFRLDLRLSDNPALNAAFERGYRVLPVFIWAPEEEGDWPPGAASRWWLHQSLHSLDSELKRHGSGLVLRRGPTLHVLRSLLQESGADAVFWNWRVEPAICSRDNRIQKALESDEIRVETHNSSLFYHPEEIKNSSSQPYRVFTPFWNACNPVSPRPAGISAPMQWEKNRPESLSLSALELEPAIDWARGLRDCWKPGEAGAHELLRSFLNSRVNHYREDRDYPASEGTSRLSPYLHFGEISPNRILEACLKRRSRASTAFLRQLGWREFAHHLLYHFPQTVKKPLRPQFSRFPWRRDRDGLRLWQRGDTGFPIVDAGMRQLWVTGWMHNRVRMIVGSFLVKDLLLPWLQGARWFWDTLVDADLANNTLGWQWVAGCGADAAPYFRIFNPDRQAEKYDPEKEYVRQWIHELGTSEYPEPVIDHRFARERALEAYALIKQNR